MILVFRSTQTILNDTTVRRKSQSIRGQLRKSVRALKKYCANIDSKHTPDGVAASKRGFCQSFYPEPKVLVLKNALWVVYRDQRWILVLQARRTNPHSHRRLGRVAQAEICTENFVESTKNNFMVGFDVELRTSDGRWIEENQERSAFGETTTATRRDVAACQGNDIKWVVAIKMHNSFNMTITV
ncbi:hypothetical protein RRG08_002844 [Elysia crispata]|uniref:Uncharacterized protein n=1 Tax=Elysia crispata TaxID=231223 RepID=A0AAE0XU99_9GAST|nr:hypothetical protein RRG08_002844 [Elysia crispata]